MRRMGFGGIYRTTGASRPHPEHAVIARVLRRLTTGQENYACATDRTHVPRTHRFVRRMTIINWLTREILSGKPCHTSGADSSVDAPRDAWTQFSLIEISGMGQGVRLSRTDCIR